MCCLEFFLVLLLSPIVLADGCVVHAPTPRISQLDGNLALVDWDRKKEETFIIKYWPKESPQNDSSIPILDDHTSFQKVELERGVTYRFRLAVTTKGCQKWFGSRIITFRSDYTRAELQEAPLKVFVFCIGVGIVFFLVLLGLTLKNCFQCFIRKFPSIKKEEIDMEGAIGEDIVDHHTTDVDDTKEETWKPPKNLKITFSTVPKEGAAGDNGEVDHIRVVKECDF